MICSHLRFVGGGRWATIVLTELAKEFPNLEIDWVCNSKFDERQNLIKNSPFLKGVNIVDKKNVSRLINPDKLIIASHSSQHCLDLVVHKNDIPLLIEKPLFPTFSEFEALSQKDKNNTFMNLEFYNAFFISDFFNKIKSYDVKEIKFLWHDPLTEKREGEENKDSEIYSSIFMDQLIHVMSMVKLLKFKSYNSNKIQLETGQDSNGYIRIISEFDGVKIEISLSRFAKARERIIDINSGEISLDFTSKPVAKEDGKYTEILPSGRLFPIAKTLSEFIEYSADGDPFPLSLESLMPEIRFCFECEDLFINDISRRLDSYLIDEQSVELIKPNLVYYAGIKYYKEIIKKRVSSEIHFLKGMEGVKQLLNWWRIYHPNR